MSESQEIKANFSLLTKDTLLALQKWGPGGESRMGWGNVRTPQGLIIGIKQLEIAEKCGFVKLIKEAPRKDQFGKLYTSIYRKFEVQRLNIKVPEPRFRRPNKKSKWPWTFVQHWNIINNCPLRMLNDSFANLAISRSRGYSNWQERRQKLLQIDREFPAIRRKSTLKDLRKQVELCLIEESPLVEEIRARYREWLASPVHVTRTLISLCVIPVFDGDRITGFESIDLDKQVDAAQELVAAIDDRFLERIGLILKKFGLVDPGIIDSYLIRVRAKESDKAPEDPEPLDPLATDNPPSLQLA